MMKMKHFATCLALLTVVQFILGTSLLLAADPGSLSSGTVDSMSNQSNDSPLATGQIEETPAAAAPVTYANFRVPGSTLRPRSSGVTFSPSGSGGCIYATSSPSDVWNTPIYLPQGATVNTLRMYYYDTSASDSNAWFTIYDLYGNIVEEWSVQTSGTFGNSFNDSVAIDHTIDYSVYSYALNWRPAVADSTMQLCGFRLFYTPPPNQNRTVMFPIVAPAK